MLKNESVSAKRVLTPVLAIPRLLLKRSPMSGLYFKAAAQYGSLTHETRI